MSVAASGNISLGIDKLRTLIAGSTNFQSWTGTANSTAALARVYTIGSTSVTRPCAIVRWLSLRIKRGGFVSGILEIMFEAATSSAYQMTGAEASDFTSAAYEFTNSIGAILHDMSLNSEAGGELFIPSSGLEIVTGLARSNITEQTDLHQWHVRVPYGLNN